MKALDTARSCDTDVTAPVLKKPVTSTALVAMLQSQMESMDFERTRRNDRSMVLRRFSRFLDALPDAPLTVDESLIGSFEDWMVDEAPQDRRYCRKFSSIIRSLVNALPESVLQRKLITKREMARRGRFDGFCDETGKLFVRFLADGRKVKRTPTGLVQTPALLSASARQNAVYAATMILRQLGLDDIREFNASHIEAYLDLCGEEGRDTAVHTLWNMRCLFRWLMATNVIADDPLAGMCRQKACLDIDYVPADQIAKLADLSTLDLGSFTELRDRLITYVLCYDFALRIGEVARLRTGDVRINEFVEVTLRSEIQKGFAKPVVTLRNLFPESRRIFEAYLALRPACSSDALLISQSGHPLLLSGCRNAVTHVSEELRIKTHGGRTPSPHRYRHSIGTLNVGEIGMRLSPYFLMRRYRHTDIRVTTQVYVTSNPLLDEAQHIATVNANGRNHATASMPVSTAMATDITVPEVEAMTRVRPLGINWRALRAHALAERVAVERSGKFHYSKDFLTRLCTEWMTRRKAMSLMGISSMTGYLNRIMNHGIGTLVIGKASLARIGDVVASLHGHIPREG